VHIKSFSYFTYRHRATNTRQTAIIIRDGPEQGFSELELGMEQFTCPGSAMTVLQYHSSHPNSSKTLRQDLENKKFP